MPQHISVRVPWHDHGWDRIVCADPMANNACLRLKNIAENRKDTDKAAICGQCMAEYGEKLSCVSGGAAFMPPQKIHRKTVHPYKVSNPKTHGHFMPTDVIYPAYSLPARPFAWQMRDKINNIKDFYNIDFQMSREPELKFRTNWVQDKDNQKAIFDYFYGDLVEDQSLCIVYAKQVPFLEDTRRQ